MENEVKICKVCGRTLPIDRFKTTRYGTKVSTCTDCATKKRRELRHQRQELESEHMIALSSYSPRELMQELARRDYEGKLRYTHEIDITNF